jgi:hypothetical protein
MFFEINSGKDTRYFLPPVNELFLSRGATIDGEFVSIVRQDPHLNHLPEGEADAKRR